MIPGPSEPYPSVKAITGSGRSEEDVSSALNTISETLEKWPGVPEGDTCLLMGGATAGIEAAARNFISKEDKVAVIGGDVYGPIIKSIVSFTGASSTLRKDVPGSLERYDTVFAVHVDTPTGRKIDMDHLLQKCRKEEVTSIADTVSSVAAEDFEFDPDVSIFSGHKTLSGPRGIGAVSFSREIAKSKAKPDSRYLDLERYRISESAYTRYPVNLILGLKAAVEEIEGEGIEDVIERHRKTGEAIRKGIEKLGKTPMGDSNAVTVFRHENPGKLKTQMESDGVLISKGAGATQNEVVRIGHMGYNAREENIMKVVEVLAKAEGENPEEALEAVRRCYS